MTAAASTGPTLVAVDAREREEIAHDGADAIDAFERDAERLAALRARIAQRRELTSRHLDVVEDVGERVVDLVCDARGEHSDRREPLGREDLLAQPHALGDVAPDEEPSPVCRRRSRLASGKPPRWRWSRRGSRGCPRPGRACCRSTDPPACGPRPAVANDGGMMSRMERADEVLQPIEGEELGPPRRSPRGWRPRDE